ncbi:DLW-39 family protein [Oerskovia flava]|nr:DLW-39 family protein [Oerskovia sp. JB1-3-2]
MKKLLLLLLTAGVGYAIWRKYTEDNSERDLWAEVTDTFE